MGTQQSRRILLYEDGFHALPGLDLRLVLDLLESFLLGRVFFHTRPQAIDHYHRVSPQMLVDRHDYALEICPSTHLPAPRFAAYQSTASESPLSTEWVGA